MVLGVQGQKSGVGRLRSSRRWELGPLCNPLPFPTVFNHATVSHHLADRHKVKPPMRLSVSACCLLGAAGASVLLLVSIVSSEVEELQAGADVRAHTSGGGKPGRNESLRPLARFPPVAALTRPNSCVFSQNFTRIRSILGRRTVRGPRVPRAANWCLNN